MLFKRSPKLHHSLNLIQANHDGNIIFSGKYLPKDILLFIHRIIKDNALFEDDKAYIAVYKEYKAHYVLYDLYPWLLYFRIPIVISAQYECVEFIEPQNYLIRKEDLERLVPTKLRIPSDIKELLITCLNRSRAYMKTIDGQELEDFGDYLEFKFLSEWPEYQSDSAAYINNFSNRVLYWFVHYAGENGQTVKNVIERTIKSNIERASNK